MLTGLSIGNFKAFGETQHIPIRPLTLIFGANSSGKSSIIHSLLLAPHALELGHWDVHQPKLASGSVDLGGFSNFMHEQQGSGTMSLRIEASPALGFVEEELYGEDAEKDPFLALKKYAVTLEIARPRAVDDAQSQQALPVIRMIGVDLDGHPACRFERSGDNTFQCSRVEIANPFLQSVLAAMLRLSDAHDRAKRKEQPSHYALADAPAVQTCEARLATLTNAFSEVLKERTFEFARVRSPLHELRALIEVTGQDQHVPGASFLEEQVQNFCGVLDLFKDMLDRIPLIEELLGAPPVDGPSGMVREADKRRRERMQGLEPAAQAVRLNLSVLLKCVTVLAGSLLRNLRYVGPLRRVPARHPGADWSALASEQGGPDAAWREACRDDAVRERVNRWLGDTRLKTPYQLGVRRLNDPENPLTEPLLEPVFRCGSTALLSHHDLGFGISQVMPVLVTAAAPIRTVIAVEQPELHLHPALQAEMGDVFIESALGERKNTFLLETHSEHLILRIMRRMRETQHGRLPDGMPPVRPEDVSVLYVEPGPRGSIVREMPLNARGELVKSWPGGFFEEGFRELFG